jgi:hypothetical protein
MRWHLKRRLAVFGPLLVLTAYGALRNDALVWVPAWGRWAIALYFLIAVYAPVFLPRPNSRTEPTTPRGPTVPLGLARKLWRTLLFIEILGFAIGVITVVILRHMFPLKYLVLALLLSFSSICATGFILRSIGRTGVSERNRDVSPIDFI